MNYTHAEVASLDPQTMRTLCEEYLANNYIDPETSERLGVKRGLRNPDGTGVLAGLTNVCDVVGYKKDQEGHVIPIPGRLIYRGVDLNESMNEAYRNDRFVFEAVIWLLLFGSLPTAAELTEFKSILEERRGLPDNFVEDIILRSPTPNIMNVMARGVLALYSYDDDPESQESRKGSRRAFARRRRSRRRSRLRRHGERCRAAIFRRWRRTAPRSPAICPRRAFCP